MFRMEELFFILAILPSCYFLLESYTTAERQNLASLLPRSLGCMSISKSRWASNILLFAISRFQTRWCALEVNVILFECPKRRFVLKKSCWSKSEVEKRRACCRDSLKNKRDCRAHWSWYFSQHGIELGDRYRSRSHLLLQEGVLQELRSRCRSRYRPRIVLLYDLPSSGALSAWLGGTSRQTLLLAQVLIRAPLSPPNAWRSMCERPSWNWGANRAHCSSQLISWQVFFIFRSQITKKKTKNFNPLRLVFLTRCQW